MALTSEQQVDAGEDDKSAVRGDADSEQSTDEGTGSDRQAPNSELSQDVKFEVLRNRRRRRVLQYLDEQEDDVVALREIAEHVAARENDKSVDAITSTERKRVYVGLYQCHLPKMDDMGVVGFDKDRGTVEISETTDQLAQFLDRCVNDRSSKSVVFDAIAISSFLAFVAIVAGVAPPWFSPVVLGGLSATLIGSRILQEIRS